MSFMFYFIHFKFLEAMPLTSVVVQCSQQRCTRVVPQEQKVVKDPNKLNSETDIHNRYSN